MGSWNQFREWLQKYADITIVGSDKLSNKWVKQKGYGIVKCAKVALAAVDGAAGVLSWQNPEDGAIMIINLQVDVTATSGAAATADFGCAATAISNDALIDGLDVGTAAIKSQSAAIATEFLECPEGGYVTGTEASGDVENGASLAGSAYITYCQIAN